MITEVSIPTCIVEGLRVHKGISPNCDQANQPGQAFGRLRTSGIRRATLEDLLGRSRFRPGLGPDLEFDPDFYPLRQIHRLQELKYSVVSLLSV